MIIYICNIGLYWDMINKMIRNGIDSNFWLREKIKPSILWRSIGVTSGTSRFLPAKISWGKRWFNHWTYGYLLALAIVGVLLMGIQPTIMGICWGYNQQHGETVGHLHIMRQQSLCDILDLLSDSLFFNLHFKGPNGLSLRRDNGDHVQQEIPVPPGAVNQFPARPSFRELKISAKDSKAAA